MKLRNCYKDFIISLEKIYPTSEATAITEMVLENSCGITRAEVIRNPDAIIENDQLVKLHAILQKLTEQMPVQYALGHAWFYHLKLLVNEHVLIPRPETEQLVEMVIENCKANKQLQILDIGTGSGCIPIAIKKNCPGMSVSSMDISADALSVAKTNAIQNEVDISWMQCDVLDHEQWQQLNMFDIIVSNPPYIPLSEKTTMDKNVTAYEPEEALFVPDEDPLIFYRCIAELGKKKLHQDGVIYMETHELLAEETAALFREMGYNATVINDYFEKTRFVKATHQ